MTRAELRAKLDAPLIAQERERRVYRYALHRRRYLPAQIEATRRKLAGLMREAEREGIKT